METVAVGPECLRDTVLAMAKSSSNVMALPFDIARAHYASAVRAGFIERSMLASARFGHTLNALERLTLGPWARPL
jgi:hypothetical protein